MRNLRLSAFLLVTACGAAQGMCDIYRVDHRASLPGQMALQNFPGLTNPFTTQPSWLATIGNQQIYARMNPYRNAIGLINANSCWYGEFAAGDKLVFVNGPTTPATITFETPDPANSGKFLPTTVSGFGFQIESQIQGGQGDYIMIRAFSTTSNTWSPWTAGQSSDSFSWSGSGRAPFAGLGSTANDISMVQINCRSMASVAFGWWAVNEPSISTAPSPAP